MYSFQEIGYSSIRFLGSVRLFLCFLGHLVVTFIRFILGRISISWSNTVKTLFLSGVRLFVPILMISALIGFSLALTFHNIFIRFHLLQSALPITQNIAIRNIIPVLLGIIISIQSALNLISVRIHKLHQMPQTVLMVHVIPTMFGIILTSFFLYIYSLTAFLIGIYSAFYFFLNVEVRFFLMNITNYITPWDIIYSLEKVMLYTSIVALVVGYYYYEVAIRKVSLRKAVSTIMTRSLLFIIVTGTYLGLFSI